MLPFKTSSDDSFSLRDPPLPTGDLTLLGRTLFYDCPSSLGTHVLTDQTPGSNRNSIFVEPKGQFTLLKNSIKLIQRPKDNERFFVQNEYVFTSLLDLQESNLGSIGID